MMVAPVDERDRNRRAGQPKGGFQSAKTGADDDHAVGIWQLRLLGRHMETPLVSDLSVRSIDVGVWQVPSKADFPIDR